jgi:hypothetical protein
MADAEMHFASAAEMADANGDDGDTLDDLLAARVGSPTAARAIAAGRPVDGEDGDDTEDLGVCDGDDGSAPCCQETGPCRWDAVCRAHVPTWERSHGGESYLGWLRRNGQVVPSWLEGDARPGQRGSGAAKAAAAVAVEPDEEEDDVAGLLLGEGGDADALAEVAGRVAADAVPEPLGDESMLPLDSDDDEVGGDDPLRDPVLAAAMESGERARANAAGVLDLDEGV